VIACGAPFTVKWMVMSEETSVVCIIFFSCS
jgi:hypothetical protein